MDGQKKKRGLLGITRFVICLPDMYYVSLGTVSPLRARPISSVDMVVFFVSDRNIIRE